MESIWQPARGFHPAKSTCGHGIAIHISLYIHRHLKCTFFLLIWVWFNVRQRNKRKSVWEFTGGSGPCYRHVYVSDRLSHKRHKRTADERQPVRREVTSTSSPASPASPAAGQHRRCCIRRPPRGMSTLCCSSPCSKTGSR